MDELLDAQKDDRVGFDRTIDSSVYDLLLAFGNVWRWYSSYRMSGGTNCFTTGNPTI